MVVYDRASGDTHCLDAMLTIAVDTLAAAGEVGADALGAALRERLGPSPDSDEWRGTLVLGELERLNLVERL